MILAENFNLDQLREYVRTQLGGAVWRLEGMGLDQNNTIDGGITNALHAYSRRCPIPKWRTIEIFPEVKVYEIPDPGYGVGRVDFLYKSMVISPFFASLVGVSPIMNLEGRDLDSFVRWRRSIMRVASVDPKWHFNEEDNTLYVNSPAQNCYAGVLTYNPRSFDKVRLVHKDWLRRASLAHVRGILGENRSKFGDQIPGPGRDIATNGSKLKDEAKADLEKLETELFGFQAKAIISFS